MREIFDETLAALDSPEPALRAKAVRTLGRLCAESDAPPYDEILAAFSARSRPGPGRETDPEVRRALFETRFSICGDRARRHGMRVERPEDLAAVDDEQLTWDVIERVWSAATIYEDRAALRSILDLATPGQCALYAIWWTQSEVNNGGFQQYFWNATGILAPEALEGFRRVGATEFAQLLEKAMALFPGGAPPGDCGKRQRALETIERREFLPLEDRFYALEKDGGLFRITAAYVRAHAEEFFED